VVCRLYTNPKRITYQSIKSTPADPSSTSSVGRNSTYTTSIYPVNARPESFRGDEALKALGGDEPLEVLGGDEALRGVAGPSLQLRPS
jgi:hypothetical protein